jgi:hypothetical protein
MDTDVSGALWALSDSATRVCNQGRTNAEAMRREFTVISAFSTSISFVAAVVVCLQVAQMTVMPEWQISPATLWALEVAVFGTAVYAWQTGISLGGWLLGITGLVLTQMCVSTVAGLGSVLPQGNFDIALGLSVALQPLPRMCAVAFSLMIFYPLRVFLPLRPVARTPDSTRFANSAAVKSADALGGPGDQPVVLVTGSDKIPVWHNGAPDGQQHAAAQPLPAALTDRAIALPLGGLLGIVPHELLDRRADKYPDSHPVSVPLEVIFPQLREAQIFVRLSDLRGWLPSGVMKAPGEEGGPGEEASVMLPLELVVSKLPAEALALPPPSPPAWAELEAPEAVSFATS